MCLSGTCGRYGEPAVVQPNTKGGLVPIHTYNPSPYPFPQTISFTSTTFWKPQLHLWLFLLFDFLSIAQNFPSAYEKKVMNHIILALGKPR